MSTIGDKRSAGRNTANLPRLVIRGPVFYGLAASALLIAAGVFMARQVMLDQIVAIDAAVVMPASESIIYSPRAGLIAKFYVSHGDHVKAGQLVARLDNAALDAEINKLTRQVKATQAKLGSIRTKIRKALALSHNSAANTKTLVAKLAGKIADVEHDSENLNKRIAQAERIVANADIYANVSGRVEMIQGLQAGIAIAKNNAVVKLVSDDNRISVKAVLPVDRYAGLRTKRHVKIILFDGLGPVRGPFRARQEPVSSDGGRNGGAQHASNEVIYKLDVPRSQIAKHITLQSGIRAKVLITSGKRNVLAQLY